MMEQQQTEQSRSPEVKTLLWLDEVEPRDGYLVEVGIERTDADEVALLTAIDGQGSCISFYWSRAQAVEVARRLLNAAAQESATPGSGHN